jgi:hypothetical protein
MALTTSGHLFCQIYLKFDPAGRDLAPADRAVWTLEMMGGSGRGCSESADVTVPRRACRIADIAAARSWQPRQQTETCVCAGWQVDLVRLRRPVRRLDVAILRQTPDMRRDVFSLMTSVPARSGSLDPAVSSGCNGANDRYAGRAA